MIATVLIKYINRNLDYLNNSENIMLVLQISDIMQMN